MYLNRVLLILSLFTATFFIQAQDNPTHEPPSLQIGLGGLNFQKGALDSELILAIIAEKQDEVKSELIKNMLLKNLGIGGGTFYAYVDNVITTLLSKKDVQITHRTLLESTINIVFTYAFVDFYIRRMDQKQRADVTKLAMSMGFIIPEKEGIEPVKNLLDFSHPRFFVQPSDENSSFNNSVLANQDTTVTQLMGVLIDIGAEVVRNNSFLRQRGLLQAPYNTGYQGLNKYLALPKCTDFSQFTFLRGYLKMKQELDSLYGVEGLASEEFVVGYNEIRDKHKTDKAKCLADEVFKGMQAQMNEMLKYVGLLFYLRDLSEMTSQRLDGLSSTDISNILFKTTFHKSKDALISDAVAKIKDIIKENPGYQSKEALSEALQLLNKLVRSDLQHPALNNNSQLLFYLKESLLPLLNNLVYKSPSTVDLVLILEDLGAMVAKELFLSLGDKHGLITSEQRVTFLNLLSRLYEFDKPETISAYLNILPEIGEIFPNSSVSQSIGMIGSFMKQYTNFGIDDKGKEYLNIDVEGLLVRLKEIKINRFRALQFHFTVGTNTISFDKPLSLASGDQLNTVSIVSEKIGLKLKLIDWEYLNTFNKGQSFRYYGKRYIRTAPPKKPVVSNLHLLAYGSGILYNVANTTTAEKDSFNSPMFGFNLGITFFNNLDMSFGRGFVLQENNDLKDNIKNRFWSFGFDIQFNEYLKKLSESRRNNKRTKTIEKYTLK